MITKKDINVYRADRKNSRIYLSIINKEFDIFRAFKTIEELIKHLIKSSYPIENKEQIIKELERGYK